MTTYYTKINGTLVDNVQKLWTKRVMTNRSGSFELQVIDPTNSFYNTVTTGDELIVYLTDGDVVQFGGYCEKPKRVGGKKYQLKITGGDYTTKANYVNVESKSYKLSEYSAIVRDLALDNICTSHVIDDMEATTDWAVADDFDVLAADSDLDGNGNYYARINGTCLKITATHSAGSGTLTKTMGTARTFLADNFIDFYFYIAAISDLGTNIKVHFGQDSSNYFTVTKAVSGNVVNAWNYLEFNVADKTTGAGAPSLTGVVWYQIEVDLDAGASSETIRMDDFRCVENKFLPSNIAITDYYVESIDFRNESIFSCWTAVKNLREDLYDFFIDKDKVINWGLLGTSASGVTLERGVNLISLDVWDDDAGLVNSLDAYGKAQLFTWEETFSGDGTTTTFATTYQPVDSYIEVDGVTQFGYTSGLTTTFDYTIGSYSIIFEAASIPASDTDNVVVRYTYLIPIHVFVNDGGSIQDYGLRPGKIENDHLTTRDDVRVFAQQYLADWKDPKQNAIAISTLETSADVGETLIVDHGRFFDSATTFVIAAVKNTFIGGKPRSVFTLTNVRKDIEKYIAELLARMNAVEEKNKPISQRTLVPKWLTESSVLDDEPDTELEIFIRDTNAEGNIYFGSPKLFSTPIAYAGGGADKYGVNQVANAVG